MKRFIAILCLLGAFCSGFISISLVDPGFGIDEMTHYLMEGIIDPPWVGYGLITIILSTMAYTLLRTGQKNEDS